MVVNALQTRHQKMRVTAGQPLPRLCQDWQRVLGPESRPAGFARALMDRYGFRRGQWPWPVLVFCPAHLGVMERNIYHQMQLSLAPRLDFTVVRRLVGRAERIEAVASPGIPTDRNPGSDRSPAPPTAERAAPSRPLSMVQPVPRVVRRPAAATATTNHSLADDTRLPGAAGLPDAGNQQPAVAAPVNLNHLTDQVIQAIDRRIIAHRERLGKI